METFDFYKKLVSLQEPLNRFAMKLTSDYDNAKDLTQDTLLKAIAYQNQFEASTNLQAWVYTIMKNTFINQYRKRTRENVYFDKSANLFFLSQSTGTNQVTPESTYSEKEITTAINSLENEFRVPFMMHVDGYKYKDIADILKINIGTVKSRIFFTRKKLAKALSGYN